MGFVEVCVFFFIFIITMFVTGLFSYIVAWINDDCDFAPYSAWLVASIAFSLCLTFVLFEKGVI